MSNVASEIKEILPEIKGHLTSFVLSDHAEAKFGGNGEYTAEALKSGVAWMLTVLGALTRSSENFELWTAHAERHAILGTVKELQTHLVNKDYSNVATTLDTLKERVRPYGLHITSDQAEVLKERAGDLHDACARLGEKQDEAEQIKVQIEQRKESVESAAKHFDAALEKLGKLEESVNQAEQARQRIATSEEEIDKLREQAKSKEEVLNSFSVEVQAGKDQLAGQEQKSQAFEKKLAEYESDHQKILEEAKSLIKAAEDALGLRTTEGISAAFIERYREEKGKWLSNISWLLASAAFVVGSAYHGYSLLTDLFAGPGANSGDLTLVSVISKLAILSVPIYAAWFCASQYVRSKNTADDYGYKSVLAQSMLGFRAQFEKPEEKTEYMKDVLKQIHQDPLRKKHDVETPFTRVVSTIFSKKQRPEESEKG